MGKKKFREKCFLADMRSVVEKCHPENFILKFEALPLLPEYALLSNILHGFEKKLTKIKAKSISYEPPWVE